MDEREHAGQSPLMLVTHLFYEPSHLGVHNVYSGSFPKDCGALPVGFGVTTLFEKAGDLGSCDKPELANFLRGAPSLRAGYAIWIYE